LIASTKKPENKDHSLHIEISNKFINDYKFNINDKDSNGDTPLLIAANRTGKLELIEYFIEKGADLTVRNNANQNIFHCLAKRGYMPLIERLKETLGHLYYEEDDYGHNADYYLKKYKQQKKAAAERKNDENTTFLPNDKIEVNVKTLNEQIILQNEVIKEQTKIIKQQENFIEEQNKLIDKQQTIIKGFIRNSQLNFLTSYPWNNPNIQAVLYTPPPPSPPSPPSPLFPTIHVEEVDQSNKRKMHDNSEFWEKNLKKARLVEAQENKYLIY
jgi:ankyrin repeat protein